MIDQFYEYCYGELAYRSLRFETEYLEDEDNYQGNAVVNYTEREVPYTRIIEHKHFEFGTQKGTVITREYPKEWSRGDEPYYPVMINITVNCMRNMHKELRRRRMYSLEADWDNTNIMIWIRWFAPHLPW